MWINVQHHKNIARHAKSCQDIFRRQLDKIFSKTNQRVIAYTHSRSFIQYGVHYLTFMPFLQHWILCCPLSKTYFHPIFPRLHQRKCIGVFGLVFIHQHDHYAKQKTKICCVWYNIIMYLLQSRTLKLHIDWKIKTKTDIMIKWQILKLLLLNQLTVQRSRTLESVPLTWSG